jgi:PiT family inorganic phosphate transporter
MTMVVIIIILALLFDYINGFHDAANSIATVVSTKVLTPFQAVLWAAMFNFVAFFIFKDHAVANTISKTVFENYITLDVILAGLIAAILWNLLTWWYGIPSSSSHTLIGGFAGAAVMHAYHVKGYMPIKDIVDSDAIVKTIWFIFLAPVIGMVISAYITLVTIKRNMWARMGLIVISSVGMFLMFDYFMSQKLDENLMKFYKVDKYKKAVAKDSTDVKSKGKLEKATALYEASKPFLKDYRNQGKNKTAQLIADNVDLSMVEEIKMKDYVALFLKLDAKKNAAFYDDKAKPAVDSAEALIVLCKPYFKVYHEIGKDSAGKKIAGILHLGEVQTTNFIKDFDIDAKKSLSKDLDKADNRMLNLSCMIVFALFAFAYIYVEVIRKPTALSMQKMFKRLQLLSSAAFSLGHGGSDAQKVMGIIGAALIANGNIMDFKEIPDWVPLACYASIALGTLSGGWKIVKTMGTKITKVTPLEGVGAETAGAITLFMTAQMGIPVSTTHTITGSIIGVGATKRLSAVRWGITRSLMFAWIITIPVSAIVAGLSYLVISCFR